jgi:hypothetical protein
MKKPIIFTDIVKQKIVPILERGSAGERIELGADDCEALLFVLRTSVPLEPFLELFSQITKATILPPAKPGRKKNNNDNSRTTSD